MQKSSAQKKMCLVFLCALVSPSKSRFIWSFPRNFASWMDKILPRWISHMGVKLILDSDLYLLHIEVTPTIIYRLFILSTNWFHHSTLCLFKLLHVMMNKQDGYGHSLAIPIYKQLCRYKSRLYMGHSSACLISKKYESC